MAFRNILIATVVLTSTILGGAAANATVVTKTYNIEFDTLLDPFAGQTPPVSPLLASFTLTFDPSVDVGNDTADIVTNYLNVTVDSPIAFSTGTDTSTGDLYISIGGLQNGPGLVGFDTNDFVLQLRFPAGDLADPQLPLCSDPGFSCGGLPTTYASGYTTTRDPDSLFLGRVATVTPAPEPAVWAMMLTGFAGLGAALRHRRRAAAAIA